MEYRRLGDTGAKVSTLCLGTMTLGEADEKSMMHGIGCDEPTAYAILTRALDAGVNFIDTADVYGNDGLCERVVGSWFEKDRRRDEVVLATKFRFRMRPGPNNTGASRFHVVRSVEESLRRLRTDRIDLYQVHMQDGDTPEEETLRALDDLVRAGKVLYLGASNYAAYRLVESQWISDRRNLNRYVSLQALYNLTARDLEREHVPACRKFGLGVLPYSPLAGGFLSGKYRKSEPPPAGSRLDKWRDRLARFDQPSHWRILDAVDAIAKERATTPAAVALAWTIAKPAITSVIFGARSLAQLEDNLKGAELKLTPEMMKTLDQASAPELGYPYEMIGRLQGPW